MSTSSTTPSPTPHPTTGAAHGWALVTRVGRRDDDGSGAVLDAWFPTPALGPATDDAAPEELRALEGEDPYRPAEGPYVC